MSARELLYLSAADVLATGVTPREAREAVLRAFAALARGEAVSLPKSTIEIGPGHIFQAMSAASAGDGIATVKWVAAAPVAAGAAGQGISGLICVSDRATGAPLAVLDGDEITLVRTAAMSAAAAVHLAPAAPRSIGFVGCGRQALAHLAAFADLFPGLERALAFSRSEASARRLAEAAGGIGLAGEVVPDPDDLVRRSDIVVSMVPGAPGLRAFLDARLLPAHAFVSAVDIGRSWLPASLGAFDVLATDSLAQSRAPYDVDTKPVEGVAFSIDLGQMASGAWTMAAPGRTMFCFRGLGIADLALAGLVVAKARSLGIGTPLPR